MMGSTDDSLNGFPGGPPAAEPMFENSGLSADDENPGFDQGHSLPNVSELKTSQRTSNIVAGEDGQVKRKGGWMVWVAVFLAVLVIAIIVAVAVVVTNNQNNNRSSNSASSTNNVVPSTPSTATVITAAPRPTVDDEKETGSDITQPPGPAPGAPPAPGGANQPTSTVAPGERTAAIEMYLVTHGVSSPVDLAQDGSPQQAALTWMSDKDPLQMQPPPIGSGVTTVEGYEFVARYALATTFYATTGDRWTFDLNFLTGEGICKWYSVLQYVDLSTELRGVFCDQTSGQPIALFFNQNNLQGTLPDEMGFLTTVTNFDLDFNKIGGTIPETFQKLDNIINLFAGANRLIGSIPTWVGGLSSLKNINLSTNFMTGRIPTSLGNLVNMEGLALDNNLFSANLDDVFDSSVMPGMRLLEQFYLENNQLTGQLGEHFLKEMSSLQYLDISDNKFQGSIPSHIFTLPSVLVLDLHDNEFTQWPTVFEENKKLALLAVQKNEFASSVPPTISNFKVLNHLDLSQNKFMGEIPSTIKTMTNLTYLFLADNEFSPNNIPFWLEDLTKLEEVSLKSTQRTGPIPDWLGDLKQLILLDLDDNNLVGTIPTTLGLLENLHILLLNRNNLTSVIPDSFANLKSLKLLYVENNEKIEGNLGTLFCANPAYLEPPVIVGDCDICNAAPNCCALCCAAGDECNTGIHVPDLDPIWQLGYNRVFFTFGREDFLDKGRATNNGGRSLEKKLVDRKKLVVGPSAKRLGQRGSL